MNSNPNFQFSILPGGEKVVTIERDPRVPGVVNFIVNKVNMCNLYNLGANKLTFAFTFPQENHLIGKLLRLMLLRDPRVIFVDSGNSHLLENKIVLRVLVNIALTLLSIMRVCFLKVRNMIVILATPKVATQLYFLYA